jgi:hypothetical protein
MTCQTRRSPGRAGKITTSGQRLRRVGAIAQLGERIVRNDEVVGSIPTSSTIFSSTCGGVSLVMPADIGFHVLPKLVGHQRAYVSNESLIDIGTLEKYKTAQRGSCP